jgi:hypothetical protein
MKTPPRDEWEWQTRARDIARRIGELAAEGDYERAIKLCPKLEAALMKVQRIKANA